MTLFESVWDVFWTVLDVEDKFQTCGEMFRTCLKGGLELFEMFCNLFEIVRGSTLLTSITWFWIRLRHFLTKMKWFEAWLTLLLALFETCLKLFSHIGCRNIWFVFTYGMKKCPCGPRGRGTIAQSRFVSVFVYLLFEIPCEPYLYLPLLVGKYIHMYIYIYLYIYISIYSLIFEICKSRVVHNITC